MAHVHPWTRLFKLRRSTLLFSVTLQRLTWSVLKAARKFTLRPKYFADRREYRAWTGQRELERSRTDLGFPKL